MAYDQYTADRITDFFEATKVNFFSKPMMGGLVFMVDNKMCCGIHYDKKKEADLLMARVGETALKIASQRKGALPMDFTGRPMKGYVFVLPEGYDLDDDLHFWLQLCLDFNPLAKASKKRKKKLSK